MLEDKSFTGKEEDIELYGEELKLQEPTFAEQEQLAHTTDGNGNFQEDADVIVITIMDNIGTIIGTIIGTTIGITITVVTAEDKDGVTRSPMVKKLLGLMPEDKKYTGKEEDTELYGEELKPQEPIFAEIEQPVQTTDGNGNFQEDAEDITTTIIEKNTSYLLFGFIYYNN